VGVIGLGTATWAQGTDVAEATEQIHMLIDAGGNLIDLAAGTPALDVAAPALADAGARRDTFLGLRQPAAPSQRDLLVTLDQALVRTGLDHVDLWTVEGWHPGMPWDELICALTVAVSSGRARYVGIAPDAAWQASLVGAGLAMHPQRLSLAGITIPYSLLDRADAEAATQVCEVLGVGLLAAAPLAAGVLTGKYRHATPPDSGGAGERFGARVHHSRSAWARPVVEGLCAAAEGLGTTPSSLAITWVLGRPAVSACITGARTVHQWRGALASAATPMPSEIRSALDEVSADAATIGHDGSREIPGD